MKMFARNVLSRSSKALLCQCLGQLLRRNFSAVTCASSNRKEVHRNGQCLHASQDRKAVVLGREASMACHPFRPLYSVNPQSLFLGSVQPPPRLLQTVSRTPNVWLRHKSGRKDVDEESDEEQLDEDDYDAPLTFKKKKIHLKSLRADSVISAGLDISRNRVDEIFYKSHLRLNGEKLLKKSKQMDEDDFVDMVTEQSSEDDQLLVKRVKIVRISPVRTSNDKREVTVKVWKKAFPVEDKTKRQY